MNDSCRVTVKPLAVRLAYLTALACLVVSSSVYAISFGHSRLLSPVGQPLQIQVPVHALTGQERDSLSVSLAAPSAWQEAGLTPPVDPASMQVAVVDGARTGSKVITIRSNQPLSTNVADLLLSVRSSSGQMQHQVSLLAPADLEVVRASGGVTTSDIGAVGAPGSSTATSIQIRRGDTLFALARRHAVSGVSVYQWMIGVMRANPQAFINNNVNLIKAGATLNVPGEQQLAALSDRQAREIFQKHAAAFAQYRQRMAREVSRIEPAAAQTADSGRVTTSEAESVPAPVPQPQDRLVLQSAQASSSTGSSTLTDPSATVASTAADSSGGNVGGQAASSNGEQSASSSASGQATRTAVNRSPAPVSNDDQLALERNTEQARERVNQLEANVKNLNQALQQQGAAAHDAVVLGAKTVEDTVEQLKQIVDGNTTGPDTAVTDSVTNSQASDTNDNNGTAPNGAAVASNAGASVGADGLGETSSVAATRVASNGGSAASSDGSGSDSSSSSSWFMDNLLIIISGALALVVLIVAWLLRRVGAERDDESDAVITEEMVRERLQSINLDLDDPSETGKSDKRS